MALEPSPGPRKRPDFLQAALVISILTACLPFAGNTSARARSVDAPGKGFPTIAVSAAIVLDQDSRQVLLSKEKDRRLPPASLTKVMTALVALESGSLHETVTVDSESAAQPQPGMGLRPGDKVALGDLIAASLITSANDACRAAAVHVGGDIGGFVGRMNERASSLGLRNTRFANPCGFDAPGHYSTAADLAALTLVALKHNRLAMMVRMMETTLQTVDGKRVFSLRNSNRLLSDPEVNGVKTGYTREAGHCLIVSAFKERKRLLLVGLNFRDRWLGPIELMMAGLYGAAPSPARLSP